jgi:uncharacterized membrane protein
MTKKEFLDELNRELESLNKEEKASALKYYEDYFDDAGEENEKDVIKELGSPKKVAEIIKDENKSEPKEEKVIKKEPMPIWLLILIGALLFPVIIPLAIGLLGTVFGLFVGLLGVFIGIITAGIGIFISGIVTCTYGAVTMFTSFPGGLLSLGVGFVLLGIGAILTMLTVKLCVFIVPPIVRGIVELCRLPFKKRGVK